MPEMKPTTPEEREQWLRDGTESGDFTRRLIHQVNNLEAPQTCKYCGEQILPTCGCAHD